MNPYEQKQEEKRERLEAAAARARREGDALIESSRQMVDAIPMGQPILVGHHSEKRDRNYRRRAWDRMGRGVERTKEADALAARAAAVGTGGISQDDPDAVVKLKEELAKYERKRDHMKAVNSAYRKGGWDAVVAAKLCNAERAENYRETMARTPWEKMPFPAYALTNCGANIRRIAKRIEQLSRPRQAAPEVAGEGFRIVDDVEANRTAIYFDAVPSEETRKQLRGYGFRWSPTEKRWQRHLSSTARYWARVVCGLPGHEDAGVEVAPPTTTETEDASA